MIQKARNETERILSKAWGKAVEVEDGEGLGGSNRSNVYRFSIRQGSENDFGSVVVKQAGQIGDESYDPDSPGGSAWRLFNDWAGLHFLTEVGGANSPAPRFLGGDREIGLVVMEDLGKGTQLDHLLLGEDAEAAEQGLMDLAKALGRLHALTIGKRSEFDRIRESLGPSETAPNPQQAVDHQRHKLHEFAQLLGLTVSSHVEEEWKHLEDFLNVDGPFQAYSHHDPCPDNCLWVDQEVKLLDFEFGGYRHALLDGVYGRIHFPTCWCVNRLPEDIFTRMEQVYRNEFTAFVVS